MLSVLFISSDLAFSTEFDDYVSETRGLKSKIRTRHSTSIKDAKKWLELSSYNLVLVDHSIKHPDLVSFLIDSWSLEQPPICAYFSRISPSKDMKGLFAIGVEDCCGVQCFEKLKALISKIPKVLSSLGTEHTTVMVIEDLDSPRDIICAFIQSLGFEEVVGVASVDEAISRLLDAPFDYFCIVCDINMPTKSGFDFISEIRGRLSLSYLPVIMLTSDPSESNLLEALKVGVTGFLAKPPKKSLLKAELAKAKRIVTLGKDPQVGTPEEIRLLEKVLKSRTEKNS